MYYDIELSLIHICKTDFAEQKFIQFNIIATKRMDSQFSICILMWRGAIESSNFTGNRQFKRTETTAANQLKLSLIAATDLEQTITLSLIHIWLVCLKQ